MPRVGGGSSAELPAWRDAKRLLWPLGLVAPSLPIIAFALGWGLGWRWGWWAGPLLIYAIVPPLDALFGKDATNPPRSALQALEDDPYYLRCLLAFLPLQYAGLLLGCWALAHLDLAFADQLGLALTLGCTAGIAITAAHELGHKSEALERRLAVLAIAQSAYGHFIVEHNRGHHARVATPEDPASARLGESFWAFLPRTALGSLRGAWAIETERLRRRGLTAWHPRNEILQAWGASVALFLGLVAVFGIAILPWLLLQAAFGAALLEAVNYVEHYGLARQKRADGRYEPCAAKHSWNGNTVLANVLLFHLQRHSDHHQHPQRRYQALLDEPDAPELPLGYSGMILLAYVPPLWRRVMDPRVAANCGGDLGLANIQPGWRGRYLG